MNTKIPRADAAAALDAFLEPESAVPQILRDPGCYARRVPWMEEGDCGDECEAGRLLAARAAVRAHYDAPDAPVHDGCGVCRGYPGNRGGGAHEREHAARVAGQVRAMTPAALVAFAADLFRLANAEEDCLQAQAFRGDAGPPAAAA